MHVHSLTELIMAIAPFVLFASISPVIFLNASTAVSSRGQRGGWQFVAGNVLVLVALGAACVGMLGAAANSFAEREIASRTVDRFLGVGLLGYAIYLGYTHWRTNARSDQRATPPTGGTASEVKAAKNSSGYVGWGAIGMLTNFTTLPIYASVSQRIGAASIDWFARILLLAIVICCVSIPSWLPVILARLRPGRSDISASARHKVARYTSLASILACVLGGGFLLWSTR